MKEYATIRDFSRFLLECSLPPGGCRLELTFIQVHYSTMQNAVLIHTFEQGPVYGEKPKPTPQPGQVLVRMTGTCLQCFVPEKHHIFSDSS
jgi:hypothetical protein